MKVAIVQLQPEFPNFWEIIPAPREGTMIVTTAMHQYGLDVVGLVENISSDIERTAAEADIVGFSLLSAYTERAYRMADRLRAEGKTIVFGGPHVDHFLSDALPHCDYAVIGDGEMAAVELVRRLAAGKPVRDLPGIAWQVNGTVHQNPREGQWQRYDGTVDLELIKDYPSFLKRRRRFGWAPVLIQATRGCPFDCAFCVAKDFFGKTYYMRTVDEVVADLKDKVRYSRDVYFSDNNIGGSVKYLRRLTEAIIESGIRMNATAYVRYEMAKNTDLLRLMRRAGFTRLLVGIESFVDGTLRDMHKHQSFGEVRDAIATFRSLGFRTSGTFIMGIGGETPETARRYLDVARALGLNYAFFFIYGVFPQMCGEDMPRERIFLNDFRYGTGHFVFFFPEHIRPSRLQEELILAHLGFYSWGRIFGKLVRGRWKDVVEMILHRRLFLKLKPHSDEYRRWLVELETGLYEGDELDTEALKKRHIPRLACFD